ncbi:2'-5' RNA ligase family protein [Arthrobacter sunyaminii]|uniref:2'-5' RNA ligase n=1 Tax=Arthrobacter sunyaminii TaxID=2816859 RepID=A0A975S565_9MICC|nr:hypothetical protein [Arthrobacter sunyaminii]MBO0907643.1 hypothetical protein [Arthrobacter sunyaminii]QWQ35204.1 hypothetical protein KG104_11915 [Arthrobacter sunyaminii]
MALPESPLSGYLSGNRRLYAQMRPDAGSLELILALQQALAARTQVNDGGRPRWVPERQVHLTLIHFGKVRDVYAVVSAAGNISWDEYEERLAAYVAATEAAMPREPILLEPAVLSRFGRHGRTLVLEYFPSSALLRAHERAYAALEVFLNSCGIPDVGAFTAADPNFMFASALRPHITLARGFAGTLPAPVHGGSLYGGERHGVHYGSAPEDGSIVPARVRLESMPVVYPEAG